MAVNYSPVRIYTSPFAAYTRVRTRRSGERGSPGAHTLLHTGRADGEGKKAHACGYRRFLHDIYINAGVASDGWCADLIELLFKVYVHVSAGVFGREFDCLAVVEANNGSYTVV